MPAVFQSVSPWRAMQTRAGFFMGMDVTSIEE
jgi:hypothetical protein